jgi:hypothetical protein
MRQDAPEPSAKAKLMQRFLLALAAGLAILMAGPVERASATLERAIPKDPALTAGPAEASNAAEKPSATAPDAAPEKTQATNGFSNALPASCSESLKLLGSGAESAYGFFCQKAESLRACASQEGRPIQHIDLVGKNGDVIAKREQRILVFGLIHGDEPLSGRLALEWGKRLMEIEPRNAWRVVPLLNPDGLRRLTRMNARGVDLNRNFPTRDWDREAMKYWQASQRKDPRRFPGANAGSELETQCAIAQIKDFKPDFIVSIHTPYAVLDFDGPKMPFPAYRALPWRALGNFPGSLGRYMWRDNNLPVLTIELKDRLVDPSAIQDIVGKLAIDASKRAGKRHDNWADLL